MTAYNPTLQAFVKLGSFLGDFCENRLEESDATHQSLLQAMQRAEIQNSWFTHDNIGFMLRQWATVLNMDSLGKWLGNYGPRAVNPKNVGIIMAGNIPLVGFHDFLCVLLSGHNAVIKQSSNDTVLLPFFADYLMEMEPQLKNRIHFTKERLENFDAIIATGSNNTSRYFEYYFGKKPNIIRKNRNSVAVLTGQESNGELVALGEDIFRYFGLGCRNISKIYVPKEYDFDILFNAIFEYKDIINQHKYANNYDYNKAVYLMSEFKILDNGFLILKEDKSLASPIASLFYEVYDNLDDLETELRKESDNIQCIVSTRGQIGDVSFGSTQKPQLHDYADGVDTMEFLSTLN